MVRKKEKKICIKLKNNLYLKSQINLYLWEDQAKSLLGKERGRITHFLPVLWTTFGETTLHTLI